MEGLAAGKYAVFLKWMAGQVGRDHCCLLAAPAVRKRCDAQGHDLEGTVLKRVQEAGRFLRELDV